MPDINAHFKRRFSRELIRCYFCQGEGVRSLKEGGEREKKNSKSCIYIKVYVSPVSFLLSAHDESMPLRLLIADLFLSCHQSGTEGCS